MTEEQMGLVPESLRVEANQPLFDAHDTLEGFMGDMITKNGTISGLQTELDTAKTGLEGKIAIPGADATEDEIKIFQRAIGVPEDVAGYGMNDVAKDDGGKALLAAFKDAGLTKAQAEKQVKLMKQMGDDHDKADRKTKDDAIAVYKESLGDKADETFKTAARGIESFFKDEESKETIAAMIMDNPKLIGAFATIGQLTKERPGLLSIGKGGKSSKVLYESMKDID